MFIQESGAGIFNSLWSSHNFQKLKYYTRQQESSKDLTPFSPRYSGPFSGIRRIIKYGVPGIPAALGKPYTAPIGKGLFEIRARGKEGIGRSFYCGIKGMEIIILHSFIKKSQKTPRKEIELARARMKEVKP